MPEPVNDAFARQKFMETIGARLIRVQPGEVDIELPFNDALGQQSGVVHAGAITAIADSACGFAALTMWPEGSDVVSVEFKINLLAPARGETFVAKGRVLRSGKTLTVCRADVFAGDVIVATMLGTMMRK